MCQSIVIQSKTSYLEQPFVFLKTYTFAIDINGIENLGTNLGQAKAYMEIIVWPCSHDLYLFG